MRARTRRAVTLVELLVVLTIVVVLSIAIAYAFIGGLDLERAQARHRSRQAEIARLDARFTRLVEAARLDDNPDDALTYFIGETEEGDGELGCDRLTFTTSGLGVPLATQLSEDEFEKQNEDNGPVGGMAEVSFSLTPIGDAGDRTGLFERLQQPSDGDPTQGGMEQVREAGVTRLGFRFYNGTDWSDTWDTRTLGRRLPAAVQISYGLEDEGEDVVHQLIVPIPASDVTATDPVNTGLSQ